MSKRVSQSEFARLIKKTPQYVNKLVKQGKVILHNKKVDVKEAKAAIASVKRASNILGDKFNKEQKGKGAKGAAEDRAAGETKEADEDVKNTSKAIQKARLLQEINAAKLKEIEYKKSIKELIPASIVDQEMAKVAEVLRSKLLSLPNRAAPKLVLLKTSHEMQVCLDKEINLILEEFQDLAETAIQNYET